jgi:hypothetical protein
VRKILPCFWTWFKPITWLISKRLLSRAPVEWRRLGYCRQEEIQGCRRVLEIVRFIKRFFYIEWIQRNFYLIQNNDGAQKAQSLHQWFYRAKYELETMKRLSRETMVSFHAEQLTKPVKIKYKWKRKRRKRKKVVQQDWCQRNDSQNYSESILTSGIPRSPQV